MLRPRYWYMEMIAKYQMEIRCDLAEVYGMDISALIADNRIEAIADFIDGLPESSRLWESIVNDPEYAYQVAYASLYSDEEESEGVEWHPPYREFTATNHILADLIDRIASLECTVAASAGGKPKRPKRYSRPRTAIDEARSELIQQEGQSIFGAFGRSPDFKTKVRRNEPEDAWYHEEGED